MPHWRTGSVLLPIGSVLTLLLIATASAAVVQTSSLPSLVSFNITAKLSRVISITMNGNILYAIDNNGNLAIVNTTALPTEGVAAITVASVLPFSSGGCCGNLAGDYGLVVKNGYAWIGGTYNVGYGLAQVSLQGLNSTVYFHGSLSAPSLNGLAADNNFVYVAASDVGIAKFDQRLHSWSTLVSGSAPVNMLLAGTTLWFNHNSGIGRVNTDGTGLDYYNTGFSSYTAFLANASDGRIWFTENQVNKIGVLDPSNSTVVEYGYPVAQGFFGAQDGPYGLTFDTKGRLWVAGGLNNNLEVFDPTAKTWTTAGNFGANSDVYEILEQGGNVWGNVDGPSGAFLYTSQLIAGAGSLVASSDVGQSVLFSCNALGGYAPYNYTWTFGDGSKSSGQTANHSYSAPGVMTATCKAMDGQNQTAIAVSTVTVSPDPAFTSFYANTTAIETGHAIGFSTTLAGGLQGYTYSWQGLPLGCSSSNSPTMSCAFTENGNYTVNVIAADANGFIVVGNPLFVQVSPSPTILSFQSAPHSLDLGQTVTFSVVMVTGAQTVSYSYSGLPAGCVTTNDSSLTCTPSTVGDYTVTILAMDSKGVTVTSSVGLTVNSPPTLSSFTVSPSPADTSRASKFNVIVDNGTGTLDYSYSGLPQGCISQDSPTLFCTPSNTGNYQVKVVVTDEAGKNASSTVSLTVNSGQLLGLPTTQTYAVISAVAAVAAIATISMTIFWRRSKGGTRALLARRS